MLLVEHCPSLSSVGKPDHGGGSGSSPPVGTPHITKLSGRDLLIELPYE